jgi:uncharacterized membrane protein SirB2
MRIRRRRQPSEVAEDVVEAAEPISAVPGKAIRRLPFVIDWMTLLAVIGLIALTIFTIMFNQKTLPANILGWWPLVIAIPAVLSFVIALARRDSRRLLASAAVFGLSLSLLLTAQKVASLPTTFLGVTFIAIGAAIILRGLLLRQQPIG